MLDLPCPVDGNNTVIDMLEGCLAKAKEGQINHCCVIMTKGPNDVFVQFTGVGGMEIAANYGADLLKRALMDVTQKRQLEETRIKGPANRVIYNIAKMPVSFDFLGSLLDAEMTRVREGAPAPLQVAWYWGKDNDVAVCLNSEQREQNFRGILQPLLRLIGAVENEAVLEDGRLVDHCTCKPVVDAVRRGEQRPTLTAPPKYHEAIKEFFEEEFKQLPVTITLREAKHTPHRNSNVPEWIKLAEWLESQGEKVVFIRDTAKSKEPLPGFTTCHAASEDLLVRCAIYENAKANLFVANGCAMLAVFGDKPWLMFNEVQEDGNYRANTTPGLLACAGIAPDEQWPWCRPDQRIVWQRDNFEILRDAWQAHIAPYVSGDDTAGRSGDAFHPFPPLPGVEGMISKEA